MTMLEKVARAIAQTQVEGFGDTWHWSAWVPAARAAIEAMREPTEDMLKAAGFNDETYCPACGYDGSWENGDLEGGLETGRIMYRAMIDAALTPAPEARKE